jgi:tetratricopeptide (TPR) repeat protein
VVSAALLIVATVAGLLHFYREESLPAARSVVSAIFPFGESKVVVAPFKGDTDGAFTVAVAKRSGNGLRTGSAILQPLAADEAVSELAERLRADAVIGGEVIESGQLTAVRAWLFDAAQSKREQIWAESFPTAARKSRLQAVGEHIQHAASTILGNTTAQPAPFPTTKAQDSYLQGRQFMDRVHSELNLRRAQGHFEAAIREDSNYGAAYAGLCVAILEAWWVADEQRQIEDAEKSCVRAQQLEPDSAETLRASAELLRKMGHAREAVDAAQHAVSAEPLDAETAMSLAAAEFDLYRQTGEARWGQLSLQHASMATRISPALAKSWQWLATYQFYVDSVGAAVPTFERAHALDPENDYVISNLGTMYMCLGRIEQARDLYLEARNTAQNSYTGDEFLGGVYYYLHDYAESARLRQLGADGAAAGGGGDIHQIYGALGDSWRRAGQSSKSLAAYRKALEIVQRDFLTGNGALADKAYRAYYSVVLQMLERRPLRAAVSESLDSDLDEVFGGSTDPSALLKVAQTRLLEGRRSDAKLALAKATRKCPGLARMPDVESLAMTGTVVANKSLP